MFRNGVTPSSSLGVSPSASLLQDQIGSIGRSYAEVVVGSRRSIVNISCRRGVPNVLEPKVQIVLGRETYAISH